MGERERALKDLERKNREKLRYKRERSKNYEEKHTEVILFIRIYPVHIKIQSKKIRVLQSP